MVMIISTKRRPFRHFFDIVLTAAGWLFFFSLFGAGILALLRDEKRGPDVILLPSQLTDSISTVAGYVLLMLAFTVFLILWAKYNQKRFSGIDRRKPPSPLVADQLRSSFGISDKQLQDMQTSRFIVMAHHDDGKIRTIRAVDEELKMRANQRAQLPVQSMDPDQEKEPLKKLTKQPHWFFLDPKLSIHYHPNHSWLDQARPYDNINMVFGGQLSLV